LAGVHHQFVADLYKLLLPGLVDRYRARVGQRVYHTEVALFTSVIRDQHARRSSKSASAATAGWSPSSTPLAREQGDGRGPTSLSRAPGGC